MVKLCKVQARGGSRLYLLFSDGTEGEVDLSGRLRGTVLEPLRDPSLFAKVSLDEFGAPCWPNGADWAPDALYLELRSEAGQEQGEGHRPG
jgi:hypothetical protein